MAKPTLAQARAVDATPTEQRFTIVGSHRYDHCTDRVELVLYAGARLIPENPDLDALTARLRASA